MHRAEHRSSSALRRVPWSLVDPWCPACGAATVATDDGGSRCLECAAVAGTETEAAFRARRVHNLTHRQPGRAIETAMTGPAETAMRPRAHARRSA